ncbi:calpain family cysteine protease [Brachionus plicatilis]|uniref:Calpain family cysteine protease n=1 Tax=Brachionus plicatilis TaxID=10195 RepID=A0A3M7SF81_BRAPC|nr:calpain family cysteine protease [Brachionus plicatilis]
MLSALIACVGIMQSPKLFTKLVPPDQNFDERIFHFRFWLYGEWVDVVVDDRLPFYSDGVSNLKEKAYAKLYGSYENLDAGQTYDALVDMSGGVPECIDLKQMSFKEKTNFWNILKQSFDKGSIISCSINADNYTREAVQYNGLVKGHAYAVTNLMIVEDRYENVKKLIRIRNPWGNNVEWRGAWCDNLKVRRNGIA